MLKLVIEDDDGRKTTVPLVRNEISIGRLEGNTIRLTERNVSRSHARIFREGGSLLIEDLSRYGTKKNGRRFAGRTTFGAGDVILIGDYRLLVRDEAAEAAGPPPMPGATPATEPAAAADPIDAMETIAMPRVQAPSPAAAVAAVSTSLPPEERSRLVCLSDAFEGSEFELVASSITIGRGAECDVVIDHSSVSKQHARVKTEGGATLIEDLGSANGILVNGAPEASATLHSGDIVELGTLRFRFVPAGDPWRYVPVIVDEVDPPGGMPVWIWGVVALIVIGGVVGVVALMGGGDDEPERQTVESGNDDPSATALAEGQRHLNAARWDDAIAAFDRVQSGTDEFEQAEPLRERAETEKANEGLYDEVVRLFDDGDADAAYRQIADIPRGSYYRTRITDENLERRILSAMIEARVERSIEAQDDRDFDGAREVMDDVRALAPNDARITTRLAEIDAAERGESPDRTPVPTADAGSDPVAVAVPTPDPTPDPTPTPTPDPTPTPTPDPTPAADPTPDPDPAANEPVDLVARATQLRGEAARAGLNGNTREAIRLLEEAAELNPYDAAIQLMLFNNYNNIGNSRRAASALRAYLRLQPNSPRRSEFEAWLETNAP